MEEDPLALETRRRIYDAVRRTPGLSGREAQRKAGTGWGETVYHLDRLTGSGLLHRERSERQDHYFVASVPLGDRRILRLMRSASARRLLIALLKTPHQTVPDLKVRTGLSAGRLSVHLRRLVETGVVRPGREGRLRTFEVTDAAGVARILVTYRSGPADEWVERAFETWSELFRR
ncbi:MAG TPA: winged helix-turn-helix transcriptional regulator [Thermoplasmata archaeon]|nr:winged helix-turn-helix transcriptional regulator [Thermoplasmata archaeon]